MKKFKPTSPGRRNMSVIEHKKVLTATKPEKSLTRGRKRAVGRNSAGRITTRHKGGGVKRKYREIDFKYDKKDIPAKVATLEYDPNRNGYIGLVNYADGEKRYILVPQKIQVGDQIIASEKAKVKLGNRLPLSKMPVGTFVYNVELKPNNGAKLIRSAGTYAEVVAQDGKMVHLKMPSTEIRKVQAASWASVGEVSNPEFRLRNYGKAGIKRKLGIRPTVRGSVMNPVDHPHGGGEGKQGIGLRRGPKTRQGKLAYGVKTRRPKKYSNKNILQRRKTKR